VKDCWSGWERCELMPARIVASLGAPINEDNMWLLLSSCFCACSTDSEVI
jgi:hypothetical protein